LINPLKYKTHILNSEGPSWSWSWSYSSWIYSYLCKQLNWSTRTPFIARCTRYNIIWWIFVYKWQVG